MSPQDPNRATDLPGRESAKNPPSTRDESRQGAAADTNANGVRKPGRLGLATTALALGLLSWGVGLKLLPSLKTEKPADGSGTITKDTVELRAESKKTDPKPAPKPDLDPPQSKKTDSKPAPKSDPESLPPETLAFAGKKAGDEWSANGLRMTFCWCPAGKFVMGSPKDEKERTPNRSPDDHQVDVTLTKGFWLAKYEATQGQWEKVMGTTLLGQRDTMYSQIHWENKNQGYYTEWWERNRLKWRSDRRERLSSEPNFGEGPNFPMYYVNHLEASDFCVKLTEQERKAGRLPPGWEYRLPTEAQWEYACRAGTKTATAFGDKLSSRQANFDGNYPYNGAEKGPILHRKQPNGSFTGYSQPVGSYRPNAWGLHDMHGNVWEWCRDWDGVWPGGADPELKLGDVLRVIRGGSWRSAGNFCRSATHHWSRWSTQDPETGFRVALVQLDPKPKTAPEPNPSPLPPAVLVNSIGMKLAPIPASTFLMGSPVDEPGRPWLGREEIDFEEQHEVTIRQPFYLGVHLVTQEQYEQIMGKAPGYEPSYFSREGEGKDKAKEFKDTKQYPRENVSWRDAREFCRRLSELPEETKAGRRYRLPTEEEWEYACRAGTSTPYYFGKTIGQQQANFSVAGPDARLASGNNLGRTTLVGYYNNPNKFGLYDMHGNLLQWCEDVYGPYQVDLRNPNNYQGQVVRGGYWGGPGIRCRSASRDKGGAASKYCGFRVALSVDSTTR